MSELVVYRALKILTMDHNCPTATHVAVRDGRVIAVGGPDCADGWGTARHDDRYGDAVLMPGLIEAHAHVMAGSIWRFTYCGHYARTDPDGRVWDGVTSAEDLVARLKAVAAETPGDQPVVGWGFDPHFVDGRRLDKVHLDAVTTDRPVVVIHSNFHLLTANSKAIETAGINAGSNIEGVVFGADGAPIGEMQEFAAMGPVMETCGVDIHSLSADPDGVRAYAKVARAVGVTTVADLLSTLDDAEVSMLERVTAGDDFCARYVPIMNAMIDAPEEAAARAVALRALSTPKLKLGYAKLFTDGAIQGFTAKLKAPGYFKGPDNGIWNMDLEHFSRAVFELHKAGVKTHIHTNGDAASALGISAIEAAVRAHPMADHRHTLEHVQLADKAQFRRMKALGICVNLFANHVHYFGDIHWSTTLGPDRARRMDACRDAWDVFGGDFAIHSDAPVTPMAPLVTAWAAVNRTTESGRVLGPAQRITVAEALRNITLGAAHVLKLDGDLGMIATGKRADFCVLDRDPMAVAPEDLRDVGVRGTVLAGVPT